MQFSAGTIFMAVGVCVCVRVSVCASVRRSINISLSSEHTWLHLKLWMKKNKHWFTSRELCILYLQRRVAPAGVKMCFAVDGSRPGAHKQFNVYIILSLQLTHLWKKGWMLLGGFYNVCSAGRDWCWAGCGLIKNKLRQHSGRQDGEKDKIYASAQLTIKPNYVWTGLMGHMLGSKFPDQEVAWKGAPVCVCVNVSVCVFDSELGQCVRDQKIKLKDKTWWTILALCH